MKFGRDRVPGGIFLGSVAGALHVEERCLRGTTPTFSHDSADFLLMSPGRMCHTVQVRPDAAHPICLTPAVCFDTDHRAHRADPGPWTAGSDEKAHYLVGTCARHRE